MTVHVALTLPLALACCHPTLAGPRTEYPAAKKGDVVDDYHGTKVADPYRWLEDDNSPETRAFTEANNQLTRKFVDGSARERIKTRLTELMDYPKISPPQHQGKYFFSKNTGLQNQSVLYVRDTLDSEPRVLIDPNTLRKDGTVALNGTEYTEDGSMMAYKLSEGGSDQATIHLREVDSGNDLPDVLKWCKFSQVAWRPDKKGFWYNRFPTPGTVDKENEARNNKMYFHALGCPQEQDALVYTPGEAELTADPFVSDDQQYLFLEIVRGSTPKNRLYYRKIDATGPVEGEFTKLFDAEDAEYRFLEHDGPVFYVLTNKDAPRKRIVAVDTNKPEKENWKELIPESADTISDVRVIADHFVVSYLHDAHEILKLFTLDGKYVKDIPLPTLGSVTTVHGKRKDRLAFIGFTSFTYSPTTLKYDFDKDEVSVYTPPQAKIDPDKFETQQVFATSKDGTRVPLFIVAKKGVSLDGNNPTILTGYGGFDISTTPGFSPSRLAWLEAGGVYATACMRGGGEYGESWHQAGMRENKQNVFDDFFAAADWLCENGYTSRKKLAIEGGSNGGLLVAACETERPDAVGAVLCHVPLTDMLRYQRFTVGRFWTPEYGDATKDAKQFAWLRAYSPLQNVKPGTAYPPTLIFTGEFDDRVAPLHARKFAAAMQAACAPDAGPILLRTETRAGHGGGKPITKVIDETADGYAFLARIFDVKF